MVRYYDKSIAGCNTYSTEDHLISKESLGSRMTPFSGLVTESARKKTPISNCYIIISH